MSSFISSMVVIILLCLIHLSPSSSASRVVGVAVKKELPPQNTTLRHPMNTPNNKNIEKVKDEKKIKNNKQSQVMKPKQQDQGQRSSLGHVLNKNGRKNNRAKRSYSKSSTKPRKTVLWRVPKIKNKLPQTVFNLDYAAPKVHPPTHN